MAFYHKTTKRAKLSRLAETFDVRETYRRWTVYGTMNDPYMGRVSVTFPQPATERQAIRKARKMWPNHRVFSVEPII